LTFECKKKILGCVPLNYNLWDEFDYNELVENQRQKDDQEYAMLLDRVRYGNANENDIKMLTTRIIDNQNIENICLLLNEIEGCIYLTSTLESVQYINNAMQNYLNIKIINIEAEDFNVNSKKITNQKNIKPKKLNLTAGLENCLSVGINSKIMLRRNLNVEKGLSNGRIGRVIDFEYINEKVDKILIKLDAIKHFSNESVNVIQKFSADYELYRNNYVTRRQFPLILAWALTIHKVQSLTLNSAIIDIGESVFESGMAYVALSRVKSFKNLYLTKLDSSKLICNENAIKEINRLRLKFTKLPQIKIYNSILQNNSNKLKRSYDTQKFVELQITNYNSINTNYKPEIKKRKANDYSDLSNNVHFLKLRNNGENFCYANAVIQALISLNSCFNEQVYIYLKSKI
jgi:hypothetical protein